MTHVAEILRTLGIATRTNIPFGCEPGGTNHYRFNPTTDLIEYRTTQDCPWRPSGYNRLLREYLDEGITIDQLASDEELLFGPETETILWLYTLCHTWQIRPETSTRPTSS